MNRLLRFKSRKSSLDEGFITLEVLISILVATAFLAVAMQSLVYAMAIKIQAQEKQRASQLINEDLETANELANRSNIGGNCDPGATYANGYGRGLWTVLNTGAIPSKYLLADGEGKQLALERTEVSAGSTSPHRTLRIRYQVWNWDGTNFLDRSGNTRDVATDEPIEETYVEIIPDVALACP